MGKAVVEAAVDELIENLRANEGIAPYLDDSTTNMPSVMQKLAGFRYTDIVDDTTNLWNFDLEQYQEHSNVGLPELLELKEMALQAVNNRLDTLSKRVIPADENIKDTFKSLAELAAMKIAKPDCEAMLDNKVLDELGKLSVEGKILKDLVSNLKKDEDFAEDINWDNISEMKAIITQEYNSVMSFEGVGKMNAQQIQAQKETASKMISHSIQKLESDLGSDIVIDGLQKHAQLAALKVAQKDYNKIMTEQQSQAQSQVQSKRSSKRLSRGEKKSSPKAKRRSRSWSRDKKELPQQKRRSRSGSLLKFIRAAKKQRQEKRRSSREMKIDKPEKDSGSKGPAPR